MKKFSFFTATILLLTSFAVFAQKGLVNPAAKYCEMLGYRYEIQSSKSSGDQGMVHLPDGRIVNAWDFFKGKVAQEYSYPALRGYEVETQIVEQDGYLIEQAVCLVHEKGETVRIPLVDFMEMNGDPIMDEENRSLSERHTDANYDPSFVPLKSLPTSFDWRNYNGNAYIGTPRDQGSCGSCYAFGATAAAEGTYNFAMGKYGSNVADFSEAYIAWCLSSMPAYNSHFYGCNGADYDYMELQALCDIGTINESYFPYSDANNQSCPSAATNAPKTKFKSWHRVTCNDIAAIKTAIMTYGVVDAAVYVTTSFQNYSGGIFSDSYTTCSSSPCYNTPTNHAISLVGWGYDATYGDYWILRNSWGSSWGEGGYMRIKATSARVACAVCYMVYENDGTTEPTVSTNTVTSIGENSAVSGGNITSNGGATVTASGLVYSKTASPTLTTGTVVSTSPVVTSGSYSLTMTGLTAGTTYYVRAYATNAKGTSYGTERTFTTAGEAPVEYCTSKGNNYSYEWIASVTVGSLTNASGAAGYTDFTNKTVTLNPGTAYNVSLTPDFASTTYNEYWKIWIDLNGDGDFDDTGELVFDAGSLSKTTVTGTLTIPSATAAITTRMRVSMKYNAAQTSCETFSYGEVEDYTVVIQSAGDTQAPTAPTNLAASNVTQTTLTLSWTASTDNVCVTGYQIYRGGALIGTTASTSYNVSGLTVATSYSFYVKAYDAAGNVSNASNTISVTTLEQTITYCTSKGNNSNYEWIASVTIGSFTNSSGAAGYTDFTSQVINLQAGQAYNISLTPGFASTTYNEYWKIWVDLNGDGDFDDAGELVFDAGTMSKTTVTGTLTIPAGTAAVSTRMRVSMKYNGAQTSCETFSYGEVEDYTVNITQATSDTQAPTAPTNLAASNITQTTLTLSWTASTDNVGVTGYQVYQGGSMIGTVTTTSCSISNLTPATTYSFYVKAYDAAGNVSAASNTISATTQSSTITYCTSKGNNATYEWIQRVQFSEMDNVSGKNNGYADFTNLTATVALGETLPIYFQAGFKSTKYTEYWSIWIDFNQNGTFDSDERVVYGSSSSSNLLSANVTIPTNAVLGSTRMRVSMKYNAAQTACETFSYGEVEDYTVNVLQSRNNTNTTESYADNLGNEIIDAYTIFPNPTRDKLYITLNGIEGDVSLSIYNIQGSLIKEVMINNYDAEIDVSDLANGVYIISVDEEKMPINKRFVKM